MDAYFFKTPFANSGDVTAIPRPAQVDGSVSMEKGFPINYEEDPDTEPTAKDVPRDQFNELMNYITTAMQALQVFGYPEFIESADNDGSPYSYSINATVRYTGGWAGVGAMNYYSLVDTNTANPTDSTKWGLVTYRSFEIPGVVKPYDGIVLPAGYVWSNGTTIGNASSNATGRANADTFALFSLYWTGWTNAVLPIYTSAGVLSTRGASAAADFAANKALATPDRRGRGLIGADNMGGATAANRITTAGCGIDGSVLGASGGAQNVALSGANNGAHVHTASTASSGSHFHTGTTNGVGDHAHTVAYRSGVEGSATGTSYSTGSGIANTFNTGNAGAHSHAFTTASDGAHTHAVTVDSAGSGTAHLNVPPGLVCNFIISLGTA
jgi:microcystin-dependent protein